MKLKVVFMGSPEFAVPSLQELHKCFEVVAVITQKDKPKGRGRTLVSTPVKDLAQRLQLPVWEPTDLRSSEFIEDLRSLNADVFVVTAFGKLLPKTVLEIPRLGCVNLHASLLPKYRGASPISSAILAGDDVAGVCTMLMDEHMDTGDVFLCTEVSIDSTDTAETLDKKLREPGARLVVETIYGLQNAKLNAKPQDHSSASYTQLLRKTDGQIDWTRDAGYLDRLVRAMIPWPVAYFDLNGNNIRVWRASAELGTAPASQIVSIEPVGIRVGTGNGILLISEVQAPGKKRMAARDFAAGHRLKQGDYLQHFGEKAVTDDLSRENT